MWIGNRRSHLIEVLVEVVKYLALQPGIEFYLFRFLMVLDIRRWTFLMTFWAFLVQILKATQDLDHKVGNGYFGCHFGFDHSKTRNFCLVFDWYGTFLTPFWILSFKIWSSKVQFLKGHILDPHCSWLWDEKVWQTNVIFVRIRYRTPKQMKA